MIFSAFRLLGLLALGATFLVMTDVVLDVSGKITPQDLPPSNFTGFPKSFSLPALKTWFGQCRESIKPWGLFISTSHYKVPPSFPRLLKRAVNNLSYFQGNYLTITLILMAYCLLTSPFLLLTVGLSLFACYMLSVRHNERRLVISGKEISMNQQYAAVGICSLPLYYWAGVGQAVFWVIGASCFVISIHAGLFNIDEVMSQEDQLDLGQKVSGLKEKMPSTGQSSLEKEESEGSQGRKSEGSQGRKSEGSQERKSEGSQGKKSEGSQGRKSEGSQGRKSEGSQGRKSEGSQGRKSDDVMQNPDSLEPEDDGPTSPRLSQS